MDKFIVNDKVNAIEAMNAKLPQVPLPLVHRFTPGMYIREIFMPKGCFVTSKIHKTIHPFVISKGEVLVYTEKEGSVRLRAPHTGITTPGTKRIIYIVEDCIWTTFHVNEGDSEDLEALEDRIIEKQANPFMELSAEEIKCLLNT